MFKKITQYFYQYVYRLYDSILMEVSRFPKEIFPFLNLQTH